MGTFCPYVVKRVHIYTYMCTKHPNRVHITTTNMKIKHLICRLKGGRYWKELPTEQGIKTFVCTKCGKVVREYTK